MGDEPQAPSPTTSARYFLLLFVLLNCVLFGGGLYEEKRGEISND